MSAISIRKGRAKDGPALLSLIDALADFEKLKRPSRSARTRLLRDAFGPKQKFNTLLAFDNKTAIGYAIIFETYSSFLAYPTLYLEDLFVLPAYRSKKIGYELFRAYEREARRRSCRRLEWIVLDWNTSAIRFYERLGAQHMKNWLFFRKSL